MPVIPPTKKAAAKGKTVPHHMTQPWAHKVMRVVSPLPELVGVSGPNSLITGLSGVMQLPLFEEPLQSGGEEVRPVAQGSSSEWDQSRPFCYLADAFQFSGPLPSSNVRWMRFLLTHPLHTLQYHHPSPFQV